MSIDVNFGSLMTMVFSTNSDLFYTNLQYESEKSYGLFGLDWKSQEQGAKIMVPLLIFSDDDENGSVQKKEMVTSTS